MTHDILADLEAIDEIPTDAVCLGIDNEGCAHYYLAREDHVWIVTEDREIEESFVPTELGKTVEDWVAFIGDDDEDTPGWADCRYDSRGAIAALADRVTVK